MQLPEYSCGPNISPAEENSAYTVGFAIKKRIKYLYILYTVYDSGLVEDVFDILGKFYIGCMMLMCRFTKREYNIHTRQIVCYML